MMRSLYAILTGICTPQPGDWLLVAYAVVWIALVAVFESAGLLR